MPCPDAKNFQPANITFDLLPGPEKERQQLQCEVALREFDGWWERAGAVAVEG